MGEALSYEAQIDAWVRTGLGNARTFSELVGLLPGIYPTVVTESLRRLDVHLPDSASERLLRLPGPVPHPIDWDWRFHPESHEALHGFLRRYAAKDVAILASPSLVRPLHERVGRIALADTNTAWSPYLEKLRVEVSWGDITLAAHRWPMRFDVAIVDPPWYPIEVQRFLATAAAVLKSGGTALLTWPAEGTRPGLVREWVELVDAARVVGLQHVARERLLLRYATPFYEGRAMQAAGVPVLAGWRRADLITFVRDGPSSAAPLQSAPNRWRAARWGALDVRARDSTSPMGPADPRLHSLIEGDVLPTVSRRDPRRERAVVWTSGNRIFGCSHPDLLISVIEGLAHNFSAPRMVRRVLGRSLTADELQWAHEAEDQLRALEAREGVEYDALHEAVPAER